MPLKVTTTKKELGVFVISPVGSINSENYKDLEKAVNAVLDLSIKAIIFDMADVDYMSSMGLSVIFKTKAAVEKKGGTLAITNLQPKVKAIFDIVRVIPDYIFASMEEADEYLDAFISNIEREKTED